MTHWHCDLAAPLPPAPSPLPGQKRLPLCLYSAMLNMSSGRTSSVQSESNMSTSLNRVT
jgi:hypothetical protein